jgi:hypothetical protein
LPLKILGIHNFNAITLLQISPLSHLLNLSNHKEKAYIDVELKGSLLVLRHFLKGDIMAGLVKKSAVAFCLAAVVVLGFAIGSYGQTKIACAGTSVTMTSQYPEVLQKLLGSGYTVYDEGVGGADAGYGWNHFVATTAFAYIVSQKPQIVTLEFGANDAHAPADWIDLNFYDMYSKFVDTFYTISPKPMVVVCIPSPLYNNATTSAQTDPFCVSLIHIVAQLRKLVADRNLPFVDFYAPLLGHPEYTTDGCHMPAQGIAADTMAHALFRLIKGTSTASHFGSPAACNRSTILQVNGNGIQVNCSGNSSWKLSVEALNGAVFINIRGAGGSHVAFNRYRLSKGIAIVRLSTQAGDCLTQTIQTKN